MGKIGIGIVGAGFAANFHARMYHELAALGAQVVAVASRTGEKAQELAHRYEIPRVMTDYHELLRQSDVDIVDLCVPNYLHHEVAVAAAQAGKHIICEKPLTGYFGVGEEDVGRTPRPHMLEVALKSADEMVHAAAQWGVKLMYAENWVYAPAIQKVRALVAASGGAILDLRGEESHHGSASSYAKHWRYTGGGALIRLGSHPIGAMLHLKRSEGMRRYGRPIGVSAVTAVTGTLTQTESFRDNPPQWLVHDWVDVENWATVILSFDDGSRGVVIASDNCLGGIKDTLDVFMSNARIRCNFSRNNLLEAYAPDPQVFADEYIVEKLETKAGWSFPSVDEEWAQGYRLELEDFVRAVQEDRAPLADGLLGREVVSVIYHAYLSAEQGWTVTISS